MVQTRGGGSTLGHRDMQEDECSLCPNLNDFLILRLQY